MAVLSEIPHGGRFHRPRYREMSFEEAMDRTNEPLILEFERGGSPTRDIIIGVCTLCNIVDPARWI